MTPLSEKARRRINELTTLAKGDRVQAERLLRGAIDREPQFLRELVEPFLAGIIAHAMAGGEIPKPAAAVSNSKSTASARSLPAGGMESLLQAMSAKAAPDTTVANKVSAGHADTIRALAEAQKARKQREG